PLSVLFIEAFPDIGTTPGGLLAAPTIIGITTNKNELGMISMLWGLGSLWCFLDAWKRRKEDRENWRSAPAFGVMLGIAVWLVVIANSATSLTCFGLGATLIVLTNLRTISKRPTLVHGVSIGLVSAALTAVFIIPSLLSTLGRNSTLTGRTDIWRLV